MMVARFGTVHFCPANTLRLFPAHWHYLLNPQYMNAGGSVDAPCFTIIARQDKMPAQLVTVEGGSLAVGIYEDDSTMVRKIKEFMALYGIVDIKMRMLKVVELKRIQGFPEEYVLIGSQQAQKKYLGNAVHPFPVKAWVEANVPQRELQTI